MEKDKRCNRVCTLRAGLLFDYFDITSLASEVIGDSQSGETCTNDNRVSQTIIFCFCLVHFYKGFEYECGVWSISLSSEAATLRTNAEPSVVISR